MNEGKLIRTLLVVFPTGLLVLGVGAMFYSHMSTAEEPVDPNQQVRLEAASLNRKAVNQADLERYLDTLAVRIGERNTQLPEKLENAAVWIESTLGQSNLGYDVDRQSYQAGGMDVRNLIAELPGTSRRDEIVVVGAHYDTVSGSPGANDNGTGVAAMIALAQAFAGDPQERTIRFVAFVNEEPPYFHTEEMGSLVYAKKCRERADDIRAMISLETIGYFSDDAGSQKYPSGLEGQFPETGNFLAFVGNAASRFVVDSAEAAFSRSCDIPAVAGVFPESVSGVSWSDHWSFWQVGYFAVMVTDTAPLRYPHYHEASDTVDKIDMEKFTEAVKGLDAVVRNWANP